jgi:hypothetical protein
MLTCTQCTSCPIIRELGDRREVEKVRAAISYERKMNPPGEPNSLEELGKIMASMVAPLRAGQKNYKFEYRIGAPGQKIIACKKSFAAVFEICQRTLDKVIFGIKPSKKPKAEVAATGAVSAELQSLMVKASKKWGFALRRSDTGLVRLPDTDLQMRVHAWLDLNLRLTSDALPNFNNEYHVAADSKLAVFRDYLGVSL